MATVPAALRRFLLCLLALTVLPFAVRAEDAGGPRRPERSLRVHRIVVAGKVDGALKERTLRYVRRALAHQANVLVFEVSCGDGDAGTAYDLADAVVRLATDRPEPAETVVYLKPGARNTATFLALAGDRLFLHPDARLGDWEPYVRAHPDEEATVRDHLADLTARKKRMSEALARGMVDHDARIEGVKPMADADPKAYLTLDAKTAERLGVGQVADSIDAVYAKLGVPPTEVQTEHSDFLDHFGAFLRDDWTRILLLVFAIAGLILELKLPGVTLPGIISALCFVLFFWSHSQVNGQMTALGLALFVLGLGLIVLEVFVLPGTAAPAVCGLVLTVGGLGLAAYGHWPQGGSDWAGYGRILGQIGLGVLGAIGLAFLLAQSLPHLPVARRLMLRPEEAAGEVAPPEPARPELAELLGVIGVAATELRPAGKMQCGEDFLDVVSNGGFVPPGSRVQVVEIEGNRIVVREV